MDFIWKFRYIFEWSNSMLAPWSTSLVTGPTVLSSNGVTEQILMTAPVNSTGSRRFFHLKVTKL